MIDKVFLDNSNKKMIIGILIDYLNKEFKINIQTFENIDIVDRITRVMISIYKDTNIKELEIFSTVEEKIGYLNKKVLKVSIPGFQKLINQLIIIRKQKKKNIIRESNNLPKSFISSDNIIPSNEAIIVEKTDIVKTEKDPVIENMVTFEEKQEEFQDKDKEFERRLELLKSKREETFRNNLNIKPSKKENEIKAQNTILETNLPNPIFSDEIIQLNSSKINFKGPEPKLLQTNKLDINLAKLPDKKQIPLKSDNINFMKSSNIGQNILPNDINIQKKLKQKLVLINASDRQWYGQWNVKDGNDILSENMNSNRYKFTIKFDSNSSENSLTYVKQSFRNIHSIELCDVILSTHDNPTLIGLKRDDIINRSPEEEDKIQNIKSDPAKNLDIITVKEKKIDNPTSLDISVKAKDNVNCKKINKYIYYTIYSFPYLLINISEFNGSILTTNCNNSFMGRLVIGKNYVNNNFCKNNDIVQGYILMKPMVTTNNCSIIFSPTPLAILDKITISLLKPNGNLYANENQWNHDNITIIGLEVTATGVNLFVDPPFHPSMYLCGDKLMIKCFEFLILQDNCVKIKKNLSLDEIEIKKYFDTQEIFYIQKTSYQSYHTQNFINCEKKDTIMEFNNVITVGLPLKLDSKCNYDFCFNTNGKWSVGANLLNINIQPVYSLNITYEDSSLSQDNLIY